MNVITELEKLISEIKSVAYAIAEINSKIGPTPPHYRLIDKRYVELYNERFRLQKRMLKLQSKLSLIKNQNQIPSNKSLFYGIISYELSKIKRSKLESLAELENKMEKIYLLIDRQLKENDDLYTQERKLKDASKKDLIQLQNKISTFQIIARKEFSNDNEIIVLIGCWEIVFENGYIVWHSAGRQCRFNIDASRQWFNKLKYILSYVVNVRLKILFDFKNYKIINIEGFEVLEKYFGYLEIDRILSQYDLGSEESFVQKIINRLDNNHTGSLYQIQSKSLYFRYLFEKQEPSYKIIPASEVRHFRSSGSIIEENAFLFSFKLKDKSYIIWENVEERRATHIFKCDSEQFERALQKVYDYISTPEVFNKREILHAETINYFKDIVLYCGSINHTIINDWKDKLSVIVNK